MKAKKETDKILCNQCGVENSHKDLPCWSCGADPEKKVEKPKADKTKAFKNDNVKLNTGTYSDNISRSLGIIGFWLGLIAIALCVYVGYSIYNTESVKAAINEVYKKY